MSKVDQEFQKLCKKIVDEGKEYENKNRGVKRLQIPSYTFRHSFSDGFPAITNKKLYWKGIVGELIWFLRGDNDVKFLNENGIKIWNKDAYNWYLRNYTESIYDTSKQLTFEEFEKRGFGSVGRNYSVQWRNFNGKTDQIKELLDTMAKDVMSSRLKVNAWNPSETELTALPPCHSEFQVIGVPLDHIQRLEILLEDQERILRNEDDINAICELYFKDENHVFNQFAIDIINEECDDQNIPSFGFELHWNQRSVDTFLGLPFNIASYGLLAKILEQISGYKALAIEGTLKCVHFYDNQYKAVEELLSRSADTHKNCEVSIHEVSTSDIDEIFNNYKISDFKLVGYSSDDEIKVEMLAPTK